MIKSFFIALKDKLEDKFGLKAFMFRITSLLVLVPTIIFLNYKLLSYAPGRIGIDSIIAFIDTIALIGIKNLIPRKKRKDFETFNVLEDKKLLNKKI